MSELLDEINRYNDIKKIAPENYSKLAKEIRRFLVKSTSVTGGHLASNLGAVELTMALHLVCDFPKDQIIWDVGHQCYTHKILTGRKEGFATLRQFGGMSGFPNREESECDVFGTGHSSTSIGMALGLAKARDLQNEQKKIFAVIGDGALSGGMAYEALNNAARLKSNLMIVLNDNEMSISKNVGGMSKYLAKIRTDTGYTGLKEDVEKALQKIPMGDALTHRIRNVKDVLKRMLIPGMLFEDMGITYIGPIDGHDIGQMVRAFQNALKLKKAVMIHVVTKKGKGYLPAVENPSAFHGVSPFYVRNGLPKAQKGVSYTQIFGESLVELAKENQKIVAISAAMPDGTGLTNFANTYPDRFSDVGIAEEHAVTYAAGLAAGGIHPVVAVYSTFLQRAYDQILHDVCLNKLPVTFAIDRAGLVGNDGATHQGVFDIAYLSEMPNMTVMAPKNGEELKKMLAFAVSQESPVAVRYPRGDAYCGLEEFDAPIEMGKSEWIRKGKDIVILALGSMVETGYAVAENFEKEGVRVSLVNARFAKPLDEDLLQELKKEHSLIVPMEEGIISGGYASSIMNYYAASPDICVCPVALPDQFIEHGAVSALKDKYQLSAKAVYQKIKEAYEKRNKGRQL